MAAYKISEARHAKGWSQAELAKRIGTTQQQIARYESGDNDVKSSVLIKLSSALGVTISYLLGLENTVAAQPAPSFPIPVFGNIAAGTPREALLQSDIVHDTEESLYRAHKSSFWLITSGNSMNKLFPDGSLVLIDPALPVQNGDVGVVFVNGEDATLKRIFFDDDAIRLHPESYDPDYRDYVIRQDDPDAPEIRVIGKVVSYTAPADWRA
ncbi:transcriptional regulator, XRE family [Coriobacterium glomerans PW2]|uniref:Transcriptional regulator, XRE family n=1 Tax=Coriobacterium glomerans (strain ATCC 49209 / DSM 20642 / JCM 10262 / PW2) TaxID=700015 RepID=F2NBT7_CORGP|nr:LexA family transcriptional regulator [Coriobacterium glomerans]AEB06896.1 transcriptional regulator, XRE family [Coriobacterium glomerans PW2]